MLDVVIPTYRAVSAIDNPNSSTPRFAILARTVLTFLWRPSFVAQKKIVRNEEVAFENEKSLREILENINGKMVKIRYILLSTFVYIRGKQGVKTQKGVWRE